MEFVAVIVAYVGVAAMIETIRRVYNGLFPDENATPAQLRTWRKFVGNLLFSLVLSAVFLGVALTTGVWRIGSIAWASDVKGQIVEAVTPLEQRVQKVETVVSAQTTMTKALLAKLAEDQLVFLIKRRCKSKDADEREYLTREIGRYSEDYELNKGKRYRPPTCDEIGYREER